MPNKKFWTIPVKFSLVQQSFAPCGKPAFFVDIYFGSLLVGIKEDDLVGSPIKGEGVAGFLIEKNFGQWRLYRKKEGIINGLATEAFGDEQKFFCPQGSVQSYQGVEGGQIFEGREFGQRKVEGKKFLFGIGKAVH